MAEDRVDVVIYTGEQVAIVKSGIKAISEVLNSKNTDEKRSLLFCLDKYLAHTMDINCHIQMRL